MIRFVEQEQFTPGVGERKPARPSLASFPSQQWDCQASFQVKTFNGKTGKPIHALVPVMNTLNTDACFPDRLDVDAAYKDGDFYCVGWNCNNQDWSFDKIKILGSGYCPNAGCTGLGCDRSQVVASFGETLNTLINESEAYFYCDQTANAVNQVMEDGIFEYLDCCNNSKNAFPQHTCWWAIIHNLPVIYREKVSAICPCPLTDLSNHFGMAMSKAKALPCKLTDKQDSTLQSDSWKASQAKMYSCCKSGQPCLDEAVKIGIDLYVNSYTMTCQSGKGVR